MLHRNEPISPRRVRLMAAAVASCFAVSAQANPTNPTVVTGTAAFSQAGNVLTVTNSNGAVIDWKTFSIGANEITRFNQASASSSVLNRVVTNDPSQIFGQLQSNGRVWLINPAGILVGAGARIDTAGFVASTLSVRTEDFLANRLNFQATPGAGNVTVEKGATIATPSGGAVYLIGTNVANEGLITTPRGETILAAGQTVNLIDTGTPGVKVEITGAQGNVTNLGEVVAEAGRIGMAGVLVKNTGNLNASSVVSEGGRIFLKASGDTLVEGGKLAATGTKGGQIEVLGDRVAVYGGAEIDASGTGGGGTVLVGGDFQGRNADVQNARITYVGNDTTIKADATDQGDGGKVIVWSDDTTRAYGSISARGGSHGGDGGFAEVSGKRHLDFRAQADLRAPVGRAGSLLLDPTDVTICVSGCEALYGNSFSNPPTSPPDYFYGGGQNSWIDWASINGQLALGNVTITTDGVSVGSGDITFNSGMYSYNSANTLSLWANRHITFNGGGIINSGAGAINMLAGWNGAYGGAAAADGSQSSGLGDLWLKNSYIYTQGSMDIRAYGKIKVDATAAGGSSVLSANGGYQWIQSMGNNIEMTGGIGGQAIIQYGGTGLQTVRGAHLLVQADQNTGAASSNYFAAISSAKDQTVYVTGGLILDAGGDPIYGGYGNYAAISANGTQQVTANSLSLSGGGGSGAAGYDNYAAIRQQSPSGSQSITIIGPNGVLQLVGGSGSGTGGSGFTDCGAPCSGWVSNNGAEIWNKGSGGQTINFAGTGTKTLSVQGGSAGNGNRAQISHDSASGAQQILGGAAIALNDGNTGGVVIHTAAEDYHLSNAAEISSESTQSIAAASIAMTGDSAGYGGAFLGGKGGTTINVTGALSMNASGAAPASGLDANGVALTDFNFGSGVAIGERNNASVALNVGSMSISSSTANNAYGGSPVMIGSLNGTANIAITSGSGIVVSSATANAFGSNVMIGSRLLAGGNILLNAGTGNLTLGQAWLGTGYGAADSVVLSSSGGGLGQATGGVIASWSLVANYGSTGTLSLPGNNEVDWVTLISAGDLNYNSNRHVHVLAASAAASPGVSISTTASTGARVFVGAITTSNNSPVAIAADGGIYDDNGTTTNISTGSGNITLTSQGGTPGDLAISTDTSTTGSINAMVASVAGNSGGIRIHNSSTSITGLTLTDNAAANNLINFFQDGGNLNISGGGPAFFVNNGGDLSVAASGNLNFSGWFNATTPTSGNIALGAGGNIVSTGSLTGGTGLSLTAGNQISLGGTASASTMITLVAPQVTVTGSVSAGDVAFITGDMVVDGGSVNAGSGNIVGLIANDLHLNNGASFHAANDIELTFTNGTSTLYLNDTTGMSASSMWAGLPATIHLLFLGRSNGGVVIDGVETTSTAGAYGSSSGFFVGASPVAADLGAGLQITYGAGDTALAPLIDALTASTGSTSDNLADTGTTGTPLPPTGSTTGTLTGDGTVGGGSGEFGGSDEDKDKKNGDDTSGGKGKNEKPQGKKPVGQCTPA